MRPAGSDARIVPSIASLIFLILLSALIYHAIAPSSQANRSAEVVETLAPEPRPVDGPFVLVVDPLPPAMNLPAVPTPAVPPPYELLVPVYGVAKADLMDTFADARGHNRRHLAIDIMAPTGTPVLAATDGLVLRMHRSGKGGITLYLLDDLHGYVYYYAHLDGYADGIEPGMRVARGDSLGYVGYTGNAHADTPHLHFAIWKQRPGGSTWGGRPVNPYVALTQ